MLAKLVARHPRSATLQRDHAEALLALGRRSEARKALEASLRGSEGCNAVARVTLADLLRAQGDRRAQHRVLQEGVARCGEQPELLNNLAWVLATSPVEALRDGREAEALARRALAAHGADSPEILDTLAAAQAETGDFAAAAATLRRAIGVAGADGRPPEVAAMLGASLARIEAGQPIRDE
jgi:hypothetical protein